MSSTGRASSRDSEARHAHSWSEAGRLPMWDSSDPERAPPPLPLNPGSQSPTTRSGTSSAIAAAARKFVEKAREDAPLSAYTTNHTPQTSPERALIKGAHHKRMQSLQPGSVKDLRSYLDSNNNRSPERSPERPASITPYSRSGSDYISSTPDGSVTPTPASKDFMKDLPALRPSSRPPTRSVFGENTPPSATMLALQTMQVPDDPLNDISNRSGTPNTPRVSNTYDFSSQLLNLTTIATNLQKEMANLSRRSKDNASDLIGLKEATSVRDEDIRKTLRELANSVTTQNLLGPPPPGGMSRSTSSYGPGFLDSKVFSSPPSGGTKAWTLPRAASVPSFDDGRIGSPSPYSVEGAASVAMLEKIIREMVTKEGQERLLSTLSELFEKSSQDNVEAAKKVEELAEFIKQKSESQALIRTDGGPPKLELDFDSPIAMERVRSMVNEEMKPELNEEVMKLLERIKDSITHTGGSTAEVKGIVRDLRGEVLGMGRELGRKLDQVSETQLNHTLDRSIEDGQGTQHTDEVQRIVEEGLNELRQHISGLLQQRQEQDDDAFKQLATTRSGPNSEEMYAVMKHALAEHGNSSTKQEPEPDAGLDRESVLEAVKEGLKDFEPNIELQQFGLERDEILAVLKEGLEDYQNNRPEPAAPGIDKAEVFEAMQEALQDFQPGASPEHVHEMKEDILENVRQALEEFRAAAPPVPAMDSEMTRMAVLEAVKEGMAEHGPAAPREIEISRDDLFDAVKSSLDGTTIPFNSFGEQVLQQLRELVEGMRVEFKQYSAANGRDTEQVLDAVKDGLESLRAEIESYVDRAQDVTGKDEIVDTVKGGLEQLRNDVQGYCAQGPNHDNGRADMLDYIKAEFEHLHEAIEGSRDPENYKTDHTAEIIFAIKEGMEDLKAHANTRSLNEEDEDSKEEMFEAMKEEFEQLKAAVLNAHASDKGELVETIQDSMGALHAKLEGSEMSNLSGGAADEILQAMREEFAQLKEQFLAAGQGEVDHDAIIASVRETIDELRTQLAAKQSEASAETLGAIREELERLKETMGSSLVPSNGVADNNNEALIALREGLEEIKEATAKSAADGGIPNELLEAMRGEFESLRNSIATSVVHSGSNEEVLDAVRLGLDDLRSHLEHKIDSPDRGQAQHSEMLDAINEGLETLRADVVKTLDKPLDMTVNYEILDTLKDGLAELRAELDKLKEDKPVEAQGGEMVLAEAGGETRELPAEDIAAAEMASAAADVANAAANQVQKEDLERVEVLLAQLQIKIEAMDATVQDAATAAQDAASAAAADKPAPPVELPEGLTVKADLEAIEFALKEVQENVLSLAAREIPAPPPPEEVATKEDTEAIETLLRNTKAHLEEMILPDPTTAVTREQLEAVEAVIHVTNDAVTGLAEKIENSTAAKADVAVVEVLAQDVKTLLEEIKEKMMAEPSEEEQAERMTKADLDVLGLLCTEIKAKVAEMELPDPAEMPTKADMESLQGLINDFRESHDKMKDSYENDIAITAKAFDDRKQEFEDTVAQIEEVKAALTEVKDELLSKLADSDTGVNALGETLKTLEDKTNDEAVVAVSADVKEMLDLVKAEFEKAHSSLEGMKVDHEQNAAMSLEKQGEHKEATVAELGDKLDLLFDGLMSKYDDAQKAAEEKAKSFEEKTAAQEELFNNTKAMADDLKLSIDTLGTALTVFTSTYPEAMEKMAEDSKTVFGRVDDTYNKLDETHHGMLNEHTATREEVLKVMTALEAVQGDLTEHNPRFLVSLEEVKALVGQHHDNSQKAAEAAEQHAQAVRELQDAVLAGFEDAKGHHTSQTEELKGALPALLPPPVELPAAPEKYDDAAVHEKLDRLIAVEPSEKYDDAAVHEKLDRVIGHVEEPAKYDDTAVHLKLDELMDHAAKASDPSAQLERLDQIHEKVMATAAEVSAFVTMQAKQITEDHENKEREAEEVALLLERRLVQKDQIEADITVMNEEKDSLRTAVEALRAEREALASQKSKLAADVSSLETALQIRREELHAMDVKAETIERRMLEGVMNQSRMLLLANSTKAPSPKKKKPQGRDLRAPSGASVMTTQTATSTVPGLKANHSLAMRSRPDVQRNGPLHNTAERRIMSLSQINHNVPTGAHAFSSHTPSLISDRPGGMKRSHSVKMQSLRSGRRGHSLSGYGGNKENETLSEEDEDNFDRSRPVSGAGTYEEFGSEAGTERRTSYGPTATESGLTYDDEGITPGSEASGYPGSDYTYGTGSYMTGSELDRRTSLGSTVTGTMGGSSSLAPMVDEDDEDREEETETELGAERDEDEVPQIEAPEHEEMEHIEKRDWAPPSDSGIGSDVPTAALGHSEMGSYFRE